MCCIYIHIHMHLYIIYVLLSKLTIMFPSAFKIHLGVFYPSSLPLPDKVPTRFPPFSLYRAHALLDPLYNPPQRGPCLLSRLLQLFQVTYI